MTIFPYMYGSMVVSHPPLHPSPHPPPPPPHHPVHPTHPPPREILESDITDHTQENNTMLSH